MSRTFDNLIQINNKTTETSTNFILHLDNMGKALDTFANICDRLPEISNNIFKGLQYIDLAFTKLANLSANFYNINEQLVQALELFSKQFPEMIDIIQEFINSYIENQEDTNYTLTNEEELEIANDFKDISSIKGNWQQVCAKKIEKWSLKNPLIAMLFDKIFIVMILGIIGGVIGNYCYAVITTNKSAVREENNTQSQIIYSIEINQEITVVNKAPYYYQIEFIDEKTNETKQGWIAKKNVKNIDTIAEEESKQEVTRE